MMIFPKKATFTLLIGSITNTLISDAFTPTSFLGYQRKTASLSVAVDPTVVTKKELDSILGIGFEGNDTSEIR